MRILFVTPYVPSRIRVRPFNLIKSLSALHEIALVSLLCDEYEQELVKDVADFCVSVDLVSLPKKQAYTNCLLALPTLMPLRVAYYQSPALVRCVMQVIKEQAIELVHGELIKVVPALQAVLSQENIPIVYDSVDCISSYLQQQLNVTQNPLRKAFIYSELKKMRGYEPKTLMAFNQAVITSSHDRDLIVKLGADQQHIQVLPNGVDTDYFTPPVVQRDKDSLVFCAKMDYYPNSQAMLNFCREVLPRIWKTRPQVCLTIVGNNPPQTIRDLSVDKRITVTGYVSDIRPYLGKASIALAPLLVTAGIQNKVLEALAMGAPVVATPGSCRSLQVKNGVHLVVADGAEAYADAVLKLLEDRQLAKNLGNAGRQYVEQHHSWTSVAGILSDLYQASVDVRERQKPISDLALLA